MKKKMNVMFSNALSPAAPTKKPTPKKKPKKPMSPAMNNLKTAIMGKGKPC